MREHGFSHPGKPTRQHMHIPRRAWQKLVLRSSSVRSILETIGHSQARNGFPDIYNFLMQQRAQLQTHPDMETRPEHGPALLGQVLGHASSFRAPFSSES